MALHRILGKDEFEVLALLTTVSDAFRRVSMHGVREELLDQQAANLDLPLEKIRIPYPCPNEVYEHKMSELLVNYQRKGLTHVLFGDLFLEDIRKYREDKLNAIGITPVFPLWKEDTLDLATEMLRIGFRALITCVDPRKLDPMFAGREYDETFLEQLPTGVDPCGENGEFHTFVYDGPIFKKPIGVAVGERVMRDGFQFADVLPIR